MSAAGEVFAELIEANLERQASRKASLEQRGLAVVTTSGSLVTLSFGFAAFIRADGSELTLATGVLLTLAMVLFVVAAALGLVVNSTRSYEYISTKSLASLCTAEKWRSDAVEATRQISEMQVRVLERARANNASKARNLRHAVITELAAIAALGGATVASLL